MEVHRIESVLILDSFNKGSITCIAPSNEHLLLAIDNSTVKMLERNTDKRFQVIGDINVNKFLGNNENKFICGFAQMNNFIIFGMNDGELLIGDINIFKDIL